ncbi:MAG: hypothetical protein V4466_02095 [Pseudomonadota bacterium]
MPLVQENTDAFGFLFGFYGLLLGLAVAEIAAGFSRAWDERQRRPLGLVGPLFGAVLLLDLLTYWLSAWGHRDLKEVTFTVAFIAALAALLYYFASTQVFPKEGQAETLDAHIMDHRKAVVFCVVASNLTSFLPALLQEIFQLHQLTAPELAIWGGLNIGYYALLVLAGWARSKRVVAGALITCLVYMSAAYLVFD